MKIKLEPFNPLLKTIKKSDKRIIEIEFNYSIKKSKCFFFCFAKALKGMASVIFKDITSTELLQPHLPRIFRKRKMRNRYKAKFVETFYSILNSSIGEKNSLLIYACEQAVLNAKEKMKQDQSKIDKEF